MENSLLEVLLTDEAVKESKTLKTQKIKSNRLARILKKDDPVEITIKELSPKQITKLSGATEKTNNYETYVKLCKEGIVDPPVKDNTLIKHFKCTTAEELVMELFSLEVAMIGEEIVKLSGVPTEEDIKN